MAKKAKKKEVTPIDLTPHVKLIDAMGKRKTTVQFGFRSEREDEDDCFHEDLEKAVPFLHFYVWSISYYQSRYHRVMIPQCALNDARDTISVVSATKFELSSGSYDYHWKCTAYDAEHDTYIGFLIPCGMVHVIWAAKPEEESIPKPQPKSLSEKEFWDRE